MPRKSVAQQARAAIARRDFAVAKKMDSDEAPQRLNRVSAVGDALGGALDPVLKKRGFANRELINRWREIAPAPYGEVARPVQLRWPKRSAAEAGGAVLEVSCHPGHALHLQHEGARLAAAINSYFGYVLVADVRLSAEPFLVAAAEPPAPAPALSATEQGRLQSRLSAIKDESLRAALEGLGRALLERGQKGKLP